MTLHIPSGVLTRRLPLWNNDVPPLRYAGNDRILERKAIGIIGQPHNDARLSEYAARIGYQCRYAGKTIITAAGTPADQALLTAAASSSTPAIAIPRHSLEQELHEGCYRSLIAFGHLLLLSPAPPDQAPSANRVAHTIQALASSTLLLDNEHPAWRYLNPELPQADSPPQIYWHSDCDIIEDANPLAYASSEHPFVVNGQPIATVEQLHLACAFPHHPKIQRQILEASNSKDARRVAQFYHRLTRPDWQHTSIPLLDWTLQIKIAAYHHTMTDLLIATENRDIAALMPGNTCLGVAGQVDGTLAGRNILGRLWQLRRQQPMTNLAIPKPPVSGHRLLGCPIRTCAPAARDYRS